MEFGVHETFPIYPDRTVQRVLINAARWARPRVFATHECPCVKPIEKIVSKAE